MAAGRTLLRRLGLALAILVALPLLGAFVLAAAIGWQTWSHNRLRDAYAEDFRALVAAHATGVSPLHRRFGLLFGNGNHCDVFVGQVVAAPDIAALHALQAALEGRFGHGAVDLLPIHQGAVLPPADTSPGTTLGGNWVPYELAQLDAWGATIRRDGRMYAAATVGVHTVVEMSLDLRCT